MAPEIGTAPAAAPGPEGAEIGPTGQGVAAEVDVEARLLDEAANNNRASAKYSNFMMEGGDADHQRTSGELLPSGREQVFDYAAEENGAEPSEREDEGHGG